MISVSASLPVFTLELSNHQHKSRRGFLLKRAHTCENIQTVIGPSLVLTIEAGIHRYKLYRELLCAVWCRCCWRQSTKRKREAWWGIIRTEKGPNSVNCMCGWELRSFAIRSRLLRNSRVINDIPSNAEVHPFNGSLEKCKINDKIAKTDGRSYLRENHAWKTDDFSDFSDRINVDFSLFSFKHDLCL